MSLGDRDRYEVLCQFAKNKYPDRYRTELIDRIGNGAVSLHRDLQPFTDPGDPNDWRHLGFRDGVDDLDGTLAQLKEQGIEPEREPYRVREGGSRICFVSDPDGYRTELIDRSGK